MKEEGVAVTVDNIKGDFEDIFRVTRHDGFCQGKVGSASGNMVWEFFANGARWVAAGKDVAAAYGWLMVPVFYGWGILCLLLKLVLLNPPILTQLLQSNLRAEIFLYGNKRADLPQENGPFLEVWYEPTRRAQRWQSRFHVLRDRMFLERFAFAPWLITPPMAVKMTRESSNQDAQFRELHISSGHGDLHFLYGDVLITQRNGRIVLEANLKVWFFLIPLYKVLFSSCFGLMRQQYEKDLLPRPGPGVSV